MRRFATLAGLIGVLWALPVSSAAAERIECDPDRGTVRVEANAFNNAATIRVVLRLTDNQLLARVSSERESGLAECPNPTGEWRSVEIQGGRGSDETEFEPSSVIPPGYSALPASIPVRASGGAANDALAGHAGIDRLEGGEGSDRLAGLAGDDALDGGPDRDRLLGGRGRDVIDAQWRFAPQFESDGAMRDRVLCGAGRDTAIVDKFDTVQGCERVEVVRPGG